MNNKTKVNLSYKLNNVRKTKSVTLNSNDTLTKIINESKDLEFFKNRLNESIFYLINNDKRFKLNKTVKIEKLNLHEGDSIALTFKDNQEPEIMNRIFIK